MRWLFVPLAIVVLRFAGPAAAQPSWQDISTAEGWAWDQIQNDQVADLNLRCAPSGRVRLDPHTDTGWDDDCRRISPEFITDVLTDPRWRDQIRQHGLRLRGAWIDGDLDLMDAEIGAELSIKESRIDGTLDLSGAHLVHDLSLAGTRVVGDFLADSLRAENFVDLSQRAWFEGDVNLLGAKVGGQIAMLGSTFEKTVELYHVTTGSDLFLSNGATFNGDVGLHGAQVRGDLFMNGSNFGRTVDGAALTVANHLFLNDKATFKDDVVLNSAKG